MNKLNNFIEFFNKNKINISVLYKYVSYKKINSKNISETQFPFHIAFERRKIPDII